MSPLRLMAPALLLAALLHGHAGAQEVESTTPEPAQTAPYQPVQHEELYLRAMRALADGHADEAAALLNRFLETEPQHAGAWLDLAISQCELGNAAQAEKLFASIEERFDPPAGIREVIQAHRAQGCRPAVRPKPRPMLALTASLGYDSNVNQGASTGTFVTGGGTEWELDDDYLPKSDQFAVLTGDYYYPIDNQGTLAFAQLRTRRHESVREQDTDALTLGIDRPLRLGLWRWRGSAVMGAIRLNNALYQRQSQVQIRVSPPFTLLLPERWDLAFVSSISHLGYPTRDSFDSNVVEFGSTLTYRKPQLQGLLSLGVQKDHGRVERLGGNRRGWYANAWLYGRVSERVTGELGYSAQLWRGERDYVPGVIDMLRHQNTRQLRGSLNYSVMPNHSVILEVRNIRNKENISLFEYNSRIVQLSWRWDGY